MVDLVQNARNPAVIARAEQDLGQMTIGYYVGHYRPKLTGRNVIALGELGGNRIYINPNLWVGVQYDTLFHELFHNVTGYADYEITDAFQYDITDLLRNVLANTQKRPRPNV